MTERFAESGVVALAILGWLVVATVVLTVPVSPGAQAVLYTAGFVALACSGALAYELYYVRARAHSAVRPRAINLIGGGMRLAFLLEFALWLQSLRALTLAYGALLATGFLLLEFLFRQLTSSSREG